VNGPQPNNGMQLTALRAAADAGSLCAKSKTEKIK